MMTWYFMEGKTENAVKCFFKAMTLCDEEDKWSVCFDLIHICHAISRDIPSDELETMLPYTMDILSHATSLYEYSHNDFYITYIQFSKEILFPLYRPANNPNSELLQVEDFIDEWFNQKSRLSEYDVNKLIRRAWFLGSKKILRYIGTMLLKVYPYYNLQWNTKAALEYLNLAISNGDLSSHGELLTAYLEDMIENLNNNNHVDMSYYKSKFEEHSKMLYCYTVKGQTPGIEYESFEGMRLYENLSNFVLGCAFFNLDIPSYWINKLKIFGFASRGIMMKINWEKILESQTNDTVCINKFRKILNFIDDYGYYIELLEDDKSFMQFYAWMETEGYVYS